jgi:hypothetical protein
VFNYYYYEQGPSILAVYANGEHIELFLKRKTSGWGKQVRNGFHTGREVFE